MTKYILNSGGYKNYPDLAKKFFSEIVKDLGDNPRFLMVYFSQPREDWEIKLTEDKGEHFKMFPDDVDPIFELAFPETFKEQAKNSDVIFIHGGDDHLLQYWLKKFNIPKIWEGKVIATSSAGSDALSKYFWIRDWRKCMDGLAILPIKFLPHYQSSYGSGDSRGPINWDKALQELKNYKEDLPIYTLKEGEYVVIEL
jgi:hypothetical protein